MRQRTLRVFEVEDFDKLKAVVESKYPLVKNHFFLLKEKNEKIESFLKSRSLNYFVTNSEANIIEKQKEVVKVVEKEVVKEVVKKGKTLFFERIIRSGEELELKEDALFFNRINAGAKIITDANIEIYAENEGLVIANGEYVIIKKNLKGTIIFNGLELEKVDKLTFFSESAKKVLE